FFFQAEDGIRDRTVTGVQTCVFRSNSIVRQARVFISTHRHEKCQRIFPTLPRLRDRQKTNLSTEHTEGHGRRRRQTPAKNQLLRSEERRVGKEWRNGWWEEHEKKTR